MGTMKECHKCKASKPLDAFGRHRKNKDGLNTICKRCACAASKTYVLLNRDKVAQRRKRYLAANAVAIAKRRKGYHQKDRAKRAKYSAAYYRDNRDEILVKAKTYRDAHSTKTNAYHKRYRLAHVKEHAARALAWQAVKKGRLIRGDCEQCGATENIHAHHANYDHPFEVTWLCCSCHRRLHATEARNAAAPR